MCSAAFPDRVEALHSGMGCVLACDILLIIGYNRGSFLISLSQRSILMAVAHITEDEQALIEAIRELARERVAPRAAEIDHTGEFPWDMQELLAQQDILAMPFPAEYGGIGASELAVV